MNTGNALANRVVIILLVLILAALGVVIYQNSQKQAGTPLMQTAQVAAEQTEPVQDAPVEENLEPVTPPAARPKPPVATRPAATAARRVAMTAAVPEPAPQDANTPAQELSLVAAPVPVPVPVAPAGAGVIGGTASEPELSGRITLSGTPPPEIPIAMDATCGRLQAGPVATRHYVVSAEGALANVFVYIKTGLEQVRFAMPNEKPLMDNVGCMFEPYVMGVRTGQEFSIRNSDPVLHNVHLSAKINREFNFAMPIKGQVIRKRLEKPEVMARIKCDVHPWMFAYIGAVSHPFFAVSDKNGEFKLPAGLPAGNYTLAAYHLKAGEITKEIAIKHGEPQKIDFQFTVYPKVAGNP